MSCSFVPTKLGIALRVKTGEPDTPDARNLSIPYNEVGAAGCKEHNQSTLRTGHVEVSADLCAIMLEGFLRGFDVALPVNHHLRFAVGTEGDGVDNARHRLFMHVRVVRRIDREFRNKPWL